MPMKTNSGQREIEVNMAGVTDGNFVLEPGNYMVEVESVDYKIAQSGNPMLTWVFKVEDVENNRKIKVFHNTSLTPQSLFNLKGLLIALGQDVPDDKMNINLDDYLGATCVASITNEEYNGKIKNKIVGFAPFEEGMM